MTFDNVKVGERVVTRTGEPDEVNYVGENYFTLKRKVGSYRFDGTLYDYQFLGQVVYRPEEVGGKIELDWGSIWEKLENFGWRFSKNERELVKRAVEQQLKGK